MIMNTRDKEITDQPRFITELFIRADFDFHHYDCLHITPTQNILITQRIFKTTSIKTYSYRLQ